MIMDIGDLRIEASIFVVSFCLSVDVAISSTVKSKLLDCSERMSSVFVFGGWVLEIIYISLRLGASWMRGSGFRKGLYSRMKEMHSGSQKIAHIGGSDSSLRNCSIKSFLVLTSLYSVGIWFLCLFIYVSIE